VKNVSTAFPLTYLSLFILSPAILGVIASRSNGAEGMLKVPAVESVFVSVFFTVSVSVAGPA
jgi:hypothetical protein